MDLVDSVGPLAPRKAVRSYISGSFFMSTMAATGMPKLETGPQKSVS